MNLSPEILALRLCLAITSCTLQLLPDVDKPQYLLLPLQLGPACLELFLQPWERRCLRMKWFYSSWVDGYIEKGFAVLNGSWKWGRILCYHQTFLSIQALKTYSGHHQLYNRNVEKPWPSPCSELQQPQNSLHSLERSWYPEKGFAVLWENICNIKPATLLPQW